MGRSVRHRTTPDGCRGFSIDRQLTLSHPTTSIPFLGAVRITTSVPALNSMASVSIPSEKITPFPDICDNILKSSFPAISPNTISVLVERLGKGSLTTKVSRSSSQLSLEALNSFPRKAWAIPAAWVITDRYQPMEPSPVETMMPLED